MFKHLDFLDKHIKNYYFQYTLNDYDKEGLEGKVPRLEVRIKSFIQLSERIGKERIIWRFDPFFMTTKLGVNELLRRVENIGNKIHQYTDKLVFSFADISIYKKVERNLKMAGVDYIEFTEKTMVEITSGISELNKNWNLELATCAEKFGLQKYGVKHNKCIDDDLMIKLFSHDKDLMRFLGVKFEEPTLFGDQNIIRKKVNLKDKGQRSACHCIMSKDIGQYNTCPHECIYCYANTSIETAFKNYKSHTENPFAETIIGK